MMRRNLAALALAGLLVGCGQGDMKGGDGASMNDGYVGGVAEERAADMDTTSPPPPAPPPPPASAPAPADPSAAGRGGETSSPTQQPAGPAPVLFLAYSYQMGLELPVDRLSGVMDRHVRACQEAGARLCQLIGSTRSGDPESSMSGFVQIRAEPVWLRGFMGNVAAQADEAGGRVRSQTVSSEDLTRQIVDTEARLRAMRALRDRLQRLLESRPGRLSDLLEVERELARVQGEIDATESNLAVMRTRVSMSELTLSYESEARPLRSDTFKPLADALANFLGLVVMGFAAIVTIVAAALPFALVLGLIGWVVLKWRQRNGGRIWRRGAPPEPPPPPANA